MKFQYSEKKVKLPGNVHAYAEKKVMKLARFFEEDAEALIVFSVEKNQNKVELTVHGAGTWFRASESTSDMFASIDAAVATIEGQIRKNKTRVEKKLKNTAFYDIPAGDAVEEEDHEVIRHKKFVMNPMSVEEAILQMDLIGHTFFMFINASTDEVNVVYKRSDGKYAVLEPIYE